LWPATFGPQVGALAVALGVPLQPWQQLVADVMCEYRLDDLGRVVWRFPKIVLTVPRQCGKSTLLAVIMIHRILTMTDHRAWYTSSTGIAARDQFHEVVRRIRHAMPDRFKFMLGAGTESIRFPATDAVIRVFPPTAESLHGRQGDFVGLDEIWSFTPEQGGSLLQAVVPTMATRGGRAQLMLTSTAGAEDSYWFRGEVDLGRAHVDEPDARTGYFEWGCPDGVDPFDEAMWPSWHPSLGQTISVEAMRSALEVMGPLEWRRAYANAWPDPASSWRQVWGSLPVEDIDPAAQVVFGVDSSPNHDHAGIVAAGPTTTGLIAVEVIEYRTGVDWVSARVVQLAKAHGATVVIASQGPLAYLVEEIRREGVNVIPASGGDYASAVSRFQTMVVGRELAHDGDAALAVAVANVRDTSAERPTWRRRDASTDISLVVAASLGVWQAALPLPPQLF
jgi:phage terminase large subunit-like protein